MHSIHSAKWFDSAFILLRSGNEITALLPLFGVVKLDQVNN